MSKEHKSLIVTILFIFLTLVIYKYFLVEGNLQKIFTSLTFFVFLPILFDKLILKKAVTSYRLHRGHWKRGLVLMAIGILLALGVAFILAKYANFIPNYTTPRALRGSFSQFLFYELVLVTFFTATYEFFFRGFVMFHLTAVFKHWSTIIQAALFVLLLFMTGGLGWGFAPYLIFAPFAGWIAYKSDSLIYSFVGQWIFIVMVDVGVIRIIT